ncbi:DUF4230 domain-containing protein [Carboxylicivirga sp. N1Y90]|uniref:DUF4230 domain-containing protein n=1 Tax=Carboxylicivirga fragile TaxID=3417571 RepID=UPI003D355BFB|nr:DUF4230 domain-containing protein [Marinilabiliaceae bacterium N1Y90]
MRLKVLKKRPVFICNSNNRFEWKDKFNKVKTDELQAIFNEDVKKRSIKEYKKSKLVMIGRGWVKAGFDFGSFNEKNFIYNKRRQTIYLIGLQPEIISTTINPWFIPEEGVEGFEFVLAKKGGLYNPEYTKKVKRNCLNKLKAQAQEKQILEKAKENAQTKLKAFFDILIEEDLKDLRFYSNYLSYNLNAFLNDSLIDKDVVALDSILLRYHAKYDSKIGGNYVLSAFMDSIKRKKYYVNDVKFQVHSRSSVLYDIINDDQIDSLDYLKIKQADKISLTDSLWYNSIELDDLHAYVASDVDSLVSGIVRFLNRPNTVFKDSVTNELSKVHMDRLLFQLEDKFGSKDE